MTDEEDHDVVGADDQDQKNKSRNHHPLCTRGGERKHILTLPDTFSTNKNWRSILWRFSPLVPDQQPANIEAQIQAPAYEETVGQYCRAAVNIAITVPLKKKKNIQPTKQSYHIAPTCALQLL